MMDENARKILDKLQLQCSKREYCVHDIYQKALEKMEWDRTAAQQIVDSLVEDRFVDDARYASAFAREKAAITGWGPVKIRFALTAKGISRDVIDAALEEIDADRADAKLVRLVEAKWRTLEGEPDGKLKLLKYALTRGYEYEDVRQLVDEITSRSASDDI